MKASTPSRSDGNRSSLFCNLLSIMVVLAAAVAPIWAEKILFQQFDGRFQRGIMIQEEVCEEGEAAQVADYPTGSTLPTDTETDRILKRADEYVRDGRYDLAIVVWQKVLDGSTSVLRSLDGRYYTSVQGYVEDQLDRLAREAPDGLKEYRLKADASARELIAQAKGKDEEKSLADVVRRFFYSSLGDDASYTLGCLMLDRHEFVAATRLFLNILTRHPDYISTKTGSAPSIPTSDVLLRLAVAAARAGDGNTARAAIAELERVGGKESAQDILQWVDRTINDGGGAIQVVGTPAGQWHTTLGSVSRDGRMTGLPASTKYTGVWRETWIARYNDQSFGISGNNAVAQTQPQVMIQRRSALPQPAMVAASTGYDERRKALVRKWEASDWTPADHMLMDNGRVYFRAYDRIMCVDGRTGKSLFSSPSKVMPQVRIIQTSSVEEVLLFGDRASNTMSIHDGILYYLEEDSNGNMPQNNQTFYRSRGGITAYRPNLANRIVALDAITGKLQWRSEIQPDESGNRHVVRYQSAPVAYGNLLLMPAVDNGALWLYARRADRNGELAWKTFLADEPPGGYSPWATTGLCVAGGDAYLVTGGVVFNIDASGGIVRWATRYQRDIDGVVNRRNYYGQSSPSPRGWDDDVLIPHGRAVVVAAHDRDAVMAMDRRTGRFLWEFQRENATHILGTSGKHLYVAGRDMIRKYDMQAGGKLVRTTENDTVLERPISGRGFIADDAIYVPMTNAIARLDPNTFKLKSIVGVAMPIADSDGTFNYNDPVGNIYSDGQRIYGTGMERAYALGPINRIAAIDVDDEPVNNIITGRAPIPRAQSTGDPNVDVLLDHGIEANGESIGQYLTDLHPSAETKKKIDQIIKQLGDDDYRTRQQAQKALLTMAVVPVEQLMHAMENATDAEVRDSAARIFAATDGKRARVLYAAMSVVRKYQLKGLAEKTLAAAPLCTQKYLLDSLGHALKATAQETDAAILRKAFANPSVEVRLVAAPALGAALGEKALPDLRALAKDADTRVRLAAGRAMADQGDRASLALLLELLEADDVIIRTGAYRSLRSFTGQKIEYVPYDDAEKRAPSIAAWKAWIESHGPTAKLTFPLEDTRFLLGRTLVANYRTGKVTEYDAQGKETWSITTANPWGVVGLPNGHRIVSSYTQRNVVEYDAKGDKVWEQTNLPNAPFNIERLDNGNTLIAGSNSHQVVEVDAAHKEVWKITIQGRPTHAIRLPSGRTLIALQNGNRVVEVDREGKEHWKIDGLLSPISAQRLPNGNTLVAEVGGNRVREFDAAGKEVWSLARIGQRNIQNPYSIERLENGNTLIGDASGAHEVDAKGTVIWETLESGVSRVTRY